MSSIITLEKELKKVQKQSGSTKQKLKRLTRQVAEAKNPVLVVERKIEKKQKEIRSLRKEKDKILKETLIICKIDGAGNGCNREIPIKTLTFIQPHYYVPPRGCTEGAYWLSSQEGNFICPHCGHRNRLYQYDRPEYLKLKEYFKDVKDIYDD